VTVVVPFAPGGSTDFVGRLIAQSLSTALGQQFVVDNRAGASGTIGTAPVARARPDGYTLLVSPNSTFAIAPHLYRLPYDNKAFVPVSLLASNAQAVCVQSSSPIPTLADLVAAAKAEPGKVSYGSGGIGVSNHLAVEPSLLHRPGGRHARGVPACFEAESRKWRDIIRERNIRLQ
jgi:tripartite-type tricarboxylate transporter receptor subunit TctC